MKWLTPFALLLTLGLFAGCDDDDDNGTDGDNGGDPRVVASIVTTAPGIDSPDDDLWDTVDSTSLTVSGTNAPKLGAGKVAATPTSMFVQAVTDGQHLFMRFSWADATYDAYPDHDTVTSVGPPLAFERAATAEEDQLYVLFNDPLSDGYDVWAWQALRTGGAMLAQGMTFAGGDLTLDSNATADLPAAIENKETGFTEPRYLPEDTSDFTGAVLPLQNTGLRIDLANTTGWTVGDTVPGWVIDTAVAGASHTDEQRGSIWDIRAASLYDNAASEYRLVLRGPVGSQYDDDIDLAALDSIQVMIGVFDNQNDFNLGGTHRAFSQPFWVILPID